MKAFIIKIYGKVQKVGFRKFIFAKSFDFNIKGYIENLPDGSVFIHAEGEGKDLEGFIEICKKGPPRASVERVDVEKIEAKRFKKFEVIRDEN